MQGRHKGKGYSQSGGRHPGEDFLEKPARGASPPEEGKPAQGRGKHQHRWQKKQAGVEEITPGVNGKDGLERCLEKIPVSGGVYGKLISLEGAGDEAVKKLASPQPPLDGSVKKQRGQGRKTVMENAGRLSFRACRRDGSGPLPGNIINDTTRGRASPAP
jgi:hypothetical protein